MTIIPTSSKESKMPKKKTERAPMWRQLESVAKLRAIDRHYLIHRHAERLADPELDALPTAKEQAEADLQAHNGIWLEKVQQDADRWQDETELQEIEARAKVAEAAAEKERKAAEDARAALEVKRGGGL